MSISETGDETEALAGDDVLRHEGVAAGDGALRPEVLATGEGAPGALSDATCSCGCGATGGDPADGIPDEELLYDLADLFKVFSDTTRIKILYALMGRELCVADIAEATQSTQSAVSHQLRILKGSRLVRFRREGRSLMYSLADDHVYTMLAQGMTHICE